MTRHGRLPSQWTSTRVQNRLLYDAVVGDGHLLVHSYLSVTGQSLVSLL